MVLVTSMDSELLVLNAAGGTLLFPRTGGAGYATFDRGDTAPIVQLRFGELPTGRIAITELHIADAVDLTGTLVRSLPFGQITTAVNRPTAIDKVRDHIRAKGDEYSPTKFGPVRVPLGPRERAPSLRLAIPQGRRRPDDFYQRVGELYTRLTSSGRSQRPAADIAKANAVPVSTVHRWIKEARNRGLLAPGQRRLDQGGT